MILNLSNQHIHIHEVKHVYKMWVCVCVWRRGRALWAVSEVREVAPNKKSQNKSDTKEKHPQNWRHMFSLDTKITTRQMQDSHTITKESCKPLFDKLSVP